MRLPPAMYVIVLVDTTARTALLLLLVLVAAVQAANTVVVPVTQAVHLALLASIKTRVHKQTARLAQGYDKF